jgi:xylan 1,4-beta-xylosidase
VDADAVLLTETVDEECCNPLKVWHEMGEPSSLTKAQLSFLQAAAQPKCESRAIAAGSQEVALNLKENAVVHFTLAPVKKEADEGYDYEWYCTHS